MYLKISTILKALGNHLPGVTEPILILANDNEKYVLKKPFIINEGNKENLTASNLQELLCSELASYMDIPTPEYRLIEVDEDTLTHFSDLRFVHKLTSGIYFATRYEENTINNLLNNYQSLIYLRQPYIKTSWNKFFSNIHNKSDIAKIITFDLAFLNFDRYSNIGNLLLTEENPSQFTLKIIDHGHAFGGPNWSISINEKLKLLNLDFSDKNSVTNYIVDHLQINPIKLQPLGLMFQALNSHINIENPEQHDFLEPISRIESITKGYLDEIFAKVPNEWYVDKKTQIRYYENFILNNKLFIKNVIEQLYELKLFINTTGGNLKWG